jgi:hypothetical protein
MFETYLIIVTTLRNKLKWINWLDWDKGQLEEPEKFNSIIVPGVLVDPSAIEWEELGKGFQLGIGPITVKLVTLLPAQTHAGDPLLELNLVALQQAEELHAAIISSSGVLRRVGSPKPYWVNTFFVIEQTYDFRYNYQPSIQLAPKPAPQINTTITVPIQ